MCIYIYIYIYTYIYIYIYHIYIYVYIHPRGQSLGVLLIGRCHWPCPRVAVSRRQAARRPREPWPRNGAVKTHRVDSRIVVLAHIYIYIYIYIYTTHAYIYIYIHTYIHT